MVNVINQVITENYSLYNGDCVEVIKGLPDESMDFSIFSPPFSSLYTFSDSERDMSNCASHNQFYKQFNFLIKELYKKIKSGRLVAIHTMDLTTGIGRDGYLSIIDLSGIIIRMMQRAGFYYHSQITIHKDPKIEVTRTKNIQLLYASYCKDSSICRQALPDKLTIFRKPGENKNPITREYDRTNKVAQNRWAELANSNWNIRQNNTLNKEKEEADERHISCLQLDLIENAIELWTNENDVVFTPFMGVGSEVWQAIKMNRKAIGIELKESYFNQAVKNMQSLTNEMKKQKLF